MGNRNKKKRINVKFSVLIYILLVRREGMKPYRIME